MKNPTRAVHGSGFGREATSEGYLAITVDRTTGESADAGADDGARGAVAAVIATIADFVA